MRQSFDKDVFEIVTRQSLNENGLTATRGLEGLCNKHDSIKLRLSFWISRLYADTVPIGFGRR